MRRFIRMTLAHAVVVKNIRNAVEENNGEELLMKQKIKNLSRKNLVEILCKVADMLPKEQYFELEKMIMEAATDNSMAEKCPMMVRMSQELIDEKLNQIIETAAHTLKVNFQNGHIWDGIKRDRLEWCGDLNQEIITSIYLYGDNKNVTNSLEFLKNDTPATAWMNNIPSYSAWWVINLCDYCRLTGNQEYFESNKDYAKAVFEHIDEYIADDGT